MFRDNFLNTPPESFTLREALQSDEFNGSDTDPLKWISLYNVPNYVVRSIQRVLALEMPPIPPRERAFAACVRHGLCVLCRSPQFQAWRNAYDQAITYDYKDAEDADDIFMLLRSFTMTIPDLNSGSQREVKFRAPETQRTHLNSTATRLGISSSSLGGVVLLDGLRHQDSLLRRDRDSMNHTVNELYRILQRRTIKIQRLLTAVREGDSAR
ncbi:MAG TPA: hypothetical protein VHQ65_07770 [Thermoanaerobaculia bacterium]|nr:hypothetical protein [Thermoanaerobaculia bacterium]